MNVLYIVCEDHQRWMIIVIYPSKFKAIYSIVNPPLTGENTKNGATLWELPDKSQISGKSRGYYHSKLRKKVKKLKTFQKLLE